MLNRGIRGEMCACAWVWWYFVMVFMAFVAIVSASQPSCNALVAPTTPFAGWRSGTIYLGGDQQPVFRFYNALSVVPIRVVDLCDKDWPGFPRRGVLGTEEATMREGVRAANWMLGSRRVKRSGDESAMREARRQNEAARFRSLEAHSETVFAVNLPSVEVVNKVFSVEVRIVEGPATNNTMFPLDVTTGAASPVSEEGAPLSANATAVVAPAMHGPDDTQVDPGSAIEPTDEMDLKRDVNDKTGNNAALRDVAQGLAQGNNTSQERKDESASRLPVCLAADVTAAANNKTSALDTAQDYGTCPRNVTTWATPAAIGDGFSADITSIADFDATTVQGQEGDGVQTVQTDGAADGAEDGGNDRSTGGSAPQSNSTSQEGKDGSASRLPVCPIGDPTAAANSTASSAAGLGTTEDDGMCPLTTANGISGGEGSPSELDDNDQPIGSSAPSDMVQSNKTGPSNAEAETAPPSFTQAGAPVRNQEGALGSFAGAMYCWASSIPVGVLKLCACILNGAFLVAAFFLVLCVITASAKGDDPIVDEPIVDEPIVHGRVARGRLPKPLLDAIVARAALASEGRGRLEPEAGSWNDPRRSSEDRDRLETDVDVWMDQGPRYDGQGRRGTMYAVIQQQQQVGEEGVNASEVVVPSKVAVVEAQGGDRGDDNDVAENDEAGVVVDGSDAVDNAGIVADALAVDNGHNDLQADGEVFRGEVGAGDGVAGDSKDGEADVIDGIQAGGGAAIATATTTTTTAAATVVHNNDGNLPQSDEEARGETAEVDRHGADEVDRHSSANTTAAAAAVSPAPAAVVLATEEADSHVGPATTVSADAKKSPMGRVASIALMFDKKPATNGCRAACSHSANTTHSAGKKADGHPLRNAATSTVVNAAVDASVSTLEAARGACSYDAAGAAGDAPATSAATDTSVIATAGSKEATIEAPGGEPTQGPSEAVSIPPAEDNNDASVVRATAKVDGDAHIPESQTVAAADASGVSLGSQPQTGAGIAAAPLEEVPAETGAGDAPDISAEEPVAPTICACEQPIEADELAVSLSCKHLCHLFCAYDWALPDDENSLILSIICGNGECGQRSRFSNPTGGGLTPDVFKAPLDQGGGGAEKPEYLPPDHVTRENLRLAEQMIEEVDSRQMEPAYLRSMFDKQESLDPKVVYALATTFAEVCRKEKNMVHVSTVHGQAKVVLFGDLHGQWYDLTAQVDKYGGLDALARGEVQLLFLGDYVDRGLYSCEVISFVMSLKVKYPHLVHTLRGNHECRTLTMKYGFHAEVIEKYDGVAYELFMHAFQAMPLCAVINGKIFCSHGGFPGVNATLLDIDKTDRFAEPESDLLMMNLLWADYGDDKAIVHTRAEELSQLELCLLLVGSQKDNTLRGCSFIYSCEALTTWLEANELELCFRGHSVQSEGYFSHFVDVMQAAQMRPLELEEGCSDDDKLLCDKAQAYLASRSAAKPVVYTVFSASMYECNNNKGSTAVIPAGGEGAIEFNVFDAVEVPPSRRKAPPPQTSMRSLSLVSYMPITILALLQLLLTIRLLPANLLKDGSGKACGRDDAEGGTDGGESDGGGDDEGEACADDASVGKIAAGSSSAPCGLQSAFACRRSSAPCYATAKLATAQPQAPRRRSAYASPKEYIGAAEFREFLETFSRTDGLEELHPNAMQLRFQKGKGGRDAWVGLLIKPPHSASSGRRQSLSLRELKTALLRGDGVNANVNEALDRAFEPPAPDMASVEGEMQGDKEEETKENGEAEQVFTELESVGLRALFGLLDSEGKGYFTIENLGQQVRAEAGYGAYMSKKAELQTCMAELDLGNKGRVTFLDYLVLAARIKFRQPTSSATT